MRVAVEFDAHGIDVSETAVRLCQARSLTTVSSSTIESLAERQQSSFDAVMLLDVVEHLDDDVGVLATARQLLTPGGIAMVTVPAYMFMWSAHDEANQHRRRSVLPGLKRRD